MLKITGFSEILALKVFKANDNKVVSSSDDKADKTVEISNKIV